MTSRTIASLRRAPATVPALLAVALFVVWATSEAGYPVTHWAPGGLLVLALLALAAGVVGVRVREIPLPTRVALGCLLAYTALSYLSILWAAVPGDAWEGANRTLLYLLVFALFAAWPQRGRSAALLLGAYALAMIALSLYVLLHVDSLHGAALQAAFPGGRLTYPSGYANANAAQWLIAFWPALLLARSARVHFSLRALLAGGAVLLAEVALLSQSRGSLYATPVMLVLVFAFVPQRVRTFALAVPVAAGIAAAAPAVLHVGDRLSREQVVSSTLHGAVVATLLAALVVALLVGAAGLLEGRLELSPGARARAHRAVGAVALLALVVALAGGLAAAGNPVTRLRHAWHSFKGGYSSSFGGGDRLTSGLGSNRYDFYRVALDEFLAHPIVGIGADNFQEQYLAHGRSSETPRYPHSVELRTLAQTGIVGALLALAGLLGALLAAARAMRPWRARPWAREPREQPPPHELAGRDSLRASVVAAALAGFAYWVVHGSFDWFFEFAGLGAPAFALLGLSCALDPAAGAPAAPEPAGSTAAGAGERASSARAVRRRARAVRVPRAVPIVLAALLALAAAYSLGAPWLSRLEVERAARIWRQAPRGAYGDLEEAASLNPLSDEPFVLAGTIALRFGDRARADREFARALARTPGDAYATLERGAIASSEGDRAAALALLQRAVALSPREPLARAALAVVRRHERVDLDALNRAILLKAQQLA